MERDQDTADILEELGVASTDTRGGLGDIIESMGLWHKAGIAED